MRSAHAASQAAGEKSSASDTAAARVLAAALASVPAATLASSHHRLLQRSLHTWGMKVWTLSPRHRSRPQSGEHLRAQRRLTGADE